MTTCLLLWLQFCWWMVSSQSTVSPINCTMAGFTIQGRYYRFWLDYSQTTASFSQAQQDCKNISNASDLAILKDQFNINLLYGQPSISCHYVGLSQSQLGSVYDPIYNWTWVDGSVMGESEFGFVDWADSSQPDNADENCAALWNGQTFGNIQCTRPCGKTCAIPGKTFALIFSV
jgi:hypothetical protein